MNDSNETSSLRSCKGHFRSYRRNIILENIEAIDTIVKHITESPEHGLMMITIDLDTKNIMLTPTNYSEETKMRHPKYGT